MPVKMCQMHFTTHAKMHSKRTLSGVKESLKFFAIVFMEVRTHSEVADVQVAEKGFHFSHHYHYLAT